jgi:hypothetical protein
MVFNRPETTARVFKAIRKARPARLLVVADGPRPGREGEAARCGEVRALIKPDWPCKLERNYAPANLGCKRRLSGGLDWVFKKAPEAVILEDDCLPAPDFFRFAEALLKRHRRDEKLMMLSGSNFLPGAWKAPADYCYTRHAFIWGWASWARAWRHYDVAMADWPGLGEGVLQSLFPGSAWQRTYWRRGMRLTHEGVMDTWDYQWIWAIWKRGGLNAVPRQNLVSNIGAGEGASHGSRVGDCPDMPLGRLRPPYRGPERLALDGDFFRAVEAKVYSGEAYFNAWRRAKTRVKEALKLS